MMPLRNRGVPDTIFGTNCDSCGIRVVAYIAKVFKHLIDSSCSVVAITMADGQPRTDCAWQTGDKYW